jgi:hypothetical protein
MVYTKTIMSLALVFALINFAVYADNVNTQYQVVYPKQAVIFAQNVNVANQIDMSTDVSLIWNEQLKKGFLRLQTGVNWPFILVGNGQVSNTNSDVIPALTSQDDWCDDSDELNGVFRNCIQYWDIELMPKEDQCTFNSQYSLYFTVKARPTDDSEYDITLENSVGTIQLFLVTSNFCNNEVDTVDLIGHLDISGSVPIKENEKGVFVVSATSEKANIASVICEQIILNTDSGNIVLFDNGGNTEAGNLVGLTINDVAGEPYKFNFGLNFIPQYFKDTKTYSFAVTINTSFIHTGPEKFKNIKNAVATGQYSQKFTVPGESFTFGKTNGGSSGVSNTTIIAAIVGSLVGASTLGAGAYFCWRKKKMGGKQDIQMSRV